MEERRKLELPRIRREFSPRENHAAEESHCSNRRRFLRPEGDSYRWEISEGPSSRGERVLCLECRDVHPRFASMEELLRECGRPADRPIEHVYKIPHRPIRASRRRQPWRAEYVT